MLQQYFFSRLKLYTIDIGMVRRVVVFDIIYAIVLDDCTMFPADRVVVLNRIICLRLGLSKYEF